MGNRLLLAIHWLVFVSSVVLIGGYAVSYFQHTTTPQPKYVTYTNYSYDPSKCLSEEDINKSEFLHGLWQKWFCQKTYSKQVGPNKPPMPEEWVILVGLLLLPTFAVIAWITQGRWIWFPWQHVTCDAKNDAVIKS